MHDDKIVCVCLSECEFVHKNNGIALCVMAKWITSRIKCYEFNSIFIGLMASLRSSCYSERTGYNTQTLRLCASMQMVFQCWFAINDFCHFFVLFARPLFFRQFFSLSISSILIELYEDGLSLNLHRCSIQSNELFLFPFDFKCHDYGN